MKRKVMTRITAFLLAFLMVCGSVFIEPSNVQAAAKATKITLSAKKKTLYVGKSFTLKVKSVQPQNASKKVTYKSSNKNVASVNTKGKVTAKSIGNATITVTSKTNKKAKAKCKITVAQGVTDIQTASTLVMQKKKSVKLHFGITPDNASKKEVKFSSNKKSVAAVTKKGVITAKKAGTAKITLKSADGCKQKTVTVKVKNKLKAAEKVTLSKNSLSLEKGKSEQLTATISPDNAGQKVVYWISSNTDVATVDKNGKVTASGMGSATITAYAADHSGKKAVCTVNVASEADSTVAVTSVTVVPAALALKTGETSAPLKAVITPENATNKAVAWSSSNEGVASVSANGAVTAKTAGTATITAKTADGGKTASCLVTVTASGKPEPVFNGNGSKYEYGHFTTEAVVLDANSEEGNPNGSYSIYHIMDYTKDVPYADSYDANGATDGNNTASMYVITSGNNALLIDMGNGAASTASHFGEDSKDEAVIARLNQEFKDLVEALAAGRHLEIAISHQHGDHVGYSSAMKEYKVYYPEGDVNDKMKDRFKDYNFTTFTPGDAFKIQVGDLTVDTLLCAGHTNASTIYIINTPIVTYNEDKTQASAKYMVFSSDAVGSGSSVWLFSAAGMRQFDEGIDEVVEKLESYSSYNAGSGLGTKNDATIQLLGGHGWQYENRFGTMTMDISYVRNMKELIHRLADRNNWRFDGDGGKTLEEWMAEGYVVLKDVGNMGRYTAYYGNPKTSAAGITGPYTAMVEYASSGFGEGEASIGSNTMQYRLYDPSAHGYEAESYPLVLFLHGEDGKGTDNVKQLTANEGAMLWVAMADENPAYVLAPQINTDDWTTDENTALVKKALDDVMKNPKVDTDRIYVQGMSMGGTGTWKMLLEYPDIFAGGMPICGKVPENYYAGISETDPAENPFTALANMPIWAFHTADDQTISADETARAVDALKAAGSKCVKYEEFSAGSTVPDAHAVWKRVYEIGTPYNWLMMQSQARTENNTKDPSMLFSKKVISDTITRVCDYELGQVFVVEDKNEVLIIDSAMGGFGAADLYAYIRDEVLVNKDAEFDVVLTHNHVDHILGLPSLANSGKLKKIYVHEKDREGLMSWLQRFNVDESYLADIKEGDTLSVGGKHLEVVETPAHTKGSICLFYDNYLFTGDAIGSGDLWLLGEYAVKDCIPGIQHLVDEIEKRGKNFELLTGHAENKYTYSNQYAKDILACVKGIVDGSIDFTIYTRRVGDYATYGSGNTFFQKSQINTLE